MVLFLLFSEENNFTWFFWVLGKIVKGSGFKDVVYQASLITSSSLNGVIAGSHYNRSWYVHEVLSEALERILVTRFLAEKRQELRTKMQKVASVPFSYSEATVNNSEEFFRSYGDYFQSTLNADNGKTAQYWARYLKMMRMQTMIHINCSREQL